MKKLLILLTFLVSTANADYCNGEWTKDAEIYCNGIKQYTKTVVIDKQYGRDRRAVQAEVEEAVKNFLIPWDLAENIISFVYQFPDDHILDPDAVAVSLEGGCIDNFAYIQAQGLEEAVLLQSK
jgi:hypothetical protein